MNAIDLATDGWLKWSIAVLRLIGVAYVALGVFSMAGLLLIPRMLASSPDAPPELAEQAVISAVAAPMMLAFAVGIAVVNFVIASALSKRKAWAFMGAVILGLMYVGSLCLPFSALILYALLRPGFKQAYDAKAAARP